MDQSQQDLIDQAKREYNATKQQAFRGKDAAFIGALLCNVRTHWTPGLGTAATNGLDLFWDPAFFLSLPKNVRVAVLLHELWHIAFLHVVRLGTKDPERWNYAADYAINNMLVDNGYTFGDLKVLVDPQYKGMSADQIYAILPQPPKPPSGGGGQNQGQGQDQDKSKSNAASGRDAFTGQNTGGDLRPDLGEGGQGKINKPSADKPLSNAQQKQAIRRVAGAVAAADASARAQGKPPSQLPGNIRENLEEVLAPVIPWETVVEDFLTERLRKGRSYRRPNRRFDPREIYLPSPISEGKLTNIVFFLDASGSMSKKQLGRFNSELRFVAEEYQPNKLTVVVFDTDLHEVIIVENGDYPPTLEITGRGGTCLRCVREYIEEHKPTVAVVLSDLWVQPMEPTEVCPILWICADNPQGQVKFGKLFHVNTERDV